MSQNILSYQFWKPWVDFGRVLGFKLRAKIDHVASCWPSARNNNNAKKQPSVFQCFLVPRPFNFQAKLTKHTSPGRSKIKQQFGQHLDLLFDRFLNQLGSILGSFLASTQVGTNCTRTQPHNQSRKMITLSTQLTSERAGLTCF